MFFDSSLRFAMIQPLEPRRLLATFLSYDFVGGDVWDPPPGTIYTSTGNRGDGYWRSLA